MRRTTDAFITAVEEARHRLSREEGATVSMREVIRRAGYTDGQRAGIAYHLIKSKRWPKGHKVPPELVERLTGPRRDGKGRPGETVLPISHAELTRAAHLAAGYRIVVSGADLPAAYAQLLGDGGITECEKREVTARLLVMIAEETARIPAPAA